MGSLLAVDLGLKTGLALYGQNGRLCWYRSKNYGRTSRLKHDINSMLKNIRGISYIVLEGGGVLAHVWKNEAKRKNIPVMIISAEKWRNEFLYQREQTTGHKAKHHAGDLARKVITWSGISRPSSLKHDTAEAIMIGLWAVVYLGWLETIPSDLRR